MLSVEEMDAPVPDSPRSESDNSPAKQRERAAAESADRQRKLQEAKALLSEAEAISSVPPSAGFASIEEHKPEEPEEEIRTSEMKEPDATDVPAAAAPARVATPPASDTAAAAAAAAAASALSTSSAAPSGDAPPALSVRRSVLLDSLSDDEDDLPRNIGIGGPRKAGAVPALVPAPASAVAAATTPPAAASAAAATSSSSVLDDSAPTTKASLADHLRAMEIQRRKEEDDKRARAAEEAESRRRKVEEEKRAAEQEQEQQRLKKEVDDARQLEQSRAAAAAATAAAAAAEEESKRQAAAAAAAAAELARQARESLEESTGARGVMMTKIPRSGSPKLLAVKIEPDNGSSGGGSGGGAWVLRWDSKSKKASECCMVLRETELVRGMVAGQFRKVKWRNQFAGAKSRVLSFLGPKRSLELVAQNDEELELIVALVRRKGIKAYRDARGTKEEEEAVDK